MITENMALPLFTTNQVLNHKPLSPELQQEQAIRLQPFYERLISLSFSDSSTAIEQCRDLCAEYGFTVKQEASTHRNIYVYCSREGLADSLRNPKSNPQRRRPSKRCDCRWRVVLFETNGHWEFRKSLNPEATKHNHTLMDPNEIERSWPKEVTHLIFALARQRLTTHDIRTRVQKQFPSIHWNERRFYNRLSEERQKIKLRDSVDRTHQLNHIWGRVCMVAAGNDDLSKIVEQQLNMLFQSVCETVQVDPHFFPEPALNSNNTIHDGDMNRKQQPKSETLQKGYLSVDVPSQIYHVKIHNSRQLQDTNILRNQKRQRTFSEESMLELPNRYPKVKQSHGSPSPSSSSGIKSPNTYSMSTTALDYNTVSAQSLPPQLSDQSSAHQQQQQQHPFAYGYNHHLTLDSMQTYVPSFPGNTSTTTTTPTHFSVTTPATDTNTTATSTTTTTTNNEFNTRAISFAFNTSPIVNNESTSSPLYPGLDPVMKSKPPSPPSSTDDLFYASLQNKTSSLQFPQGYTSKTTAKLPIMNNESYQRQMMFIPPVTSRPF